VPPPIAPTTVVNQGVLAGTVSSFSLIGPTLAPVEISPTPVNIAVGLDVVIDAEESGVNVRSGAGIANTRLFVAPNGTIFRVIGGPAQADGLTWWQIQNTVDVNQTGWAAAAYLEVLLPGGTAIATP
jgi:Bacterial SH3 domain